VHTPSGSVMSNGNSKQACGSDLAVVRVRRND
jgi:hypothetical protein